MPEKAARFIAQSDDHRKRHAGVFPKRRRRAGRAPRDKLVRSGLSEFRPRSAMSVTIKTPEEIEKMRIAGRLAADVLEMIGEHVRPGVTTEELDRICHDYIVNVQKAIPAPLNYGAAPGRPGFPKS